MKWLTDLLNHYPELAVYLALGIGFWVGSIKIRGFSLGGVTGSLLGGILTGLLFHPPIPGPAKSIVFLLFVFGIGYEVGPQFLRAMKGSGWRYAVLGVVMPVLGLLTAWAAARCLRLDPGFSAGMLSGALTESPAMGTATEAIHSLDVSDVVKQTWSAHVAVADALCYVFGALGVILMCSSIGPWLLRVNLQAEAAKVEAQYGIQRTRAGIVSAWQPFEFRAYRLPPGGRAAGCTIAEAESLIPGARLFVARLRRGTEILEPQPDLRLEAGDVVVISGRREVLVELLGERAQEVDDRELLDLPVASFELFVSSSSVAGHTLEQIAKDEAVRGVFLRRLIRRGQEIPIGTRTEVERGDVMHVVGTEAAVKRAAKAVGVIVAPSEATDFVAVGFAICVGAALGAAAAFKVGGVSVSIGTSVGALIAGLVTGYLRSLRPLFGRVPDGAVKFMQSYGLAAFVAIVGIGAGPHFVEGVREAGLSIVLGGMVVTLVPLVAGLYFGRYVLGMSPLLLLGALSGAQTFAGGMAAVQEKSGSAIAVIGYSGSVAVAHVFLTVWGTVIVLLMSGGL